MADPKIKDKSGRALCVVGLDANQSRPPKSAFGGRSQPEGDLGEARTQLFQSNAANGQSPFAQPNSLPPRVLDGNNGDYQSALNNPPTVIFGTFTRDWHPLETEPIPAAMAQPTWVQGNGLPQGGALATQTVLVQPTSGNIPLEPTHVQFGGEAPLSPTMFVQDTPGYVGDESTRARTPEEQGVALAQCAAAAAALRDSDAPKPPRRSIGQVVDDLVASVKRGLSSVVASIKAIAVACLMCIPRIKLESRNHEPQLPEPKVEPLIPRSKKTPSPLLKRQIFEPGDNPASLLLAPNGLNAGGSPIEDEDYGTDPLLLGTHELSDEPCMIYPSEDANRLFLDQEGLEPDGQDVDPSFSNPPALRSDDLGEDESVDEETATLVFDDLSSLPSGSGSDLDEAATVAFSDNVHEFRVLFDCAAESSKTTNRVGVQLIKAVKGNGGTVTCQLSIYPVKTNAGYNYGVYNAAEAQYRNRSDVHVTPQTNPADKSQSYLVVEGTYSALRDGNNNDVVGQLLNRVKIRFTF
ncbi:hypothetical protein KKD40_04415 [Candidatus Micrarchaeota archaeon]|nr:hypothetical protein [Candidatus Micrarchaeota archaeon]